MKDLTGKRGWVITKEKMLEDRISKDLYTVQKLGKWRTIHMVLNTIS